MLFSVLLHEASQNIVFFFYYKRSSQQHNCAIYIYQVVKSILAQSTLGTRFTTNTSIDRSEYAKIHVKLFHIPS